MPSRFWQVAHFGFGVSYRVPQVTQDWLFLDMARLQADFQECYSPLFKFSEGMPYAGMVEIVMGVSHSGPIEEDGG